MAKSKNDMRFKAGVLGRKENDLCMTIHRKRDLRPGEIRAMVEKKWPFLQGTVGEAVLEGRT